MRLLARILTSVLALGAVSIVSAQAPVISGSVTYRERMALPPTAFLEVRLDDVSRPGVIPPVVSTTMIERPGQVPIRFELKYDAQKIDANGRYAVRATIKDGTAILFSSQDTVLVLTQGHGTRAELVLSRVAPLPAPAAPAAPPPAPPLPPNPLMDLPATFVGTVPCADCEGIRMQLNLFPDDSFFVRMTYIGRSVPPQDDLGSWALSSDRRVLILKGRGAAPEMWAAGKPGTLRKLGADGRPIESKVPYELTRASELRPLAAHGLMRGAYTSTDDATSFIECSTGQLWTVAPEGVGADLKAAYVKTRPVDGSQVIAEIEGTLSERPKAGGASAVLVVDRLVKVLPHESCAPRFSNSPLLNTDWRLTHLGDRAVPAVTDVKRQPSLTFTIAPGNVPNVMSGTYAGNTGCNRVVGTLQAQNASLTLTSAGTLVACRQGAADEAAFVAALKSTRAYRITGHVLELLDDSGTRLMRFEARTPAGVTRRQSVRTTKSPAQNLREDQRRDDRSV